MSYLDPVAPDHETRVLARFTCPECGKPLEMMEIRATREERELSPDHCEWVAVCRRCEIGFSKPEWDRRRAA